MPDLTPTESRKSPSWLRLGIALAIALSSDTFSFFTSAWVVTEPAVIVVDVATAVLLWWVLGRPALLFVVFVAEAIPGIGMIPLWTMVVGALAMTGRLPAAMAARAARTSAPPPTSPPNHDQAP
ncbi:MAG: hypothetical protein EXS17_00995 [Phycisphaerales bacterium]|nr:hypothetical protein [Phycisphaerales bacterium]